MKQRIAVRAIIKDELKVLLLQRSAGRESILGRLELPGGRVQYGEQPEDALRRIIQSDTGVSAQVLQLYDVVTYIDHDDRDIQYVVIVYNVTLAASHQSVVPGQSYEKHVWMPMKNIQQKSITDLTSLLLGILQQKPITDMDVDLDEDIDDINATENSVTVYSDGGSRGNPGPSAAGFIIINQSHEVVEQGGEYIGITTSSQAEYHGVRLGLERALELGYRSIDFRVDSMLVVNQMNGTYKIKNRELWPIYERIRKLVEQFDSVRFYHVKREFNRLADGIVNQTLDTHAQS